MNLSLARRHHAVLTRARALSFAARCGGLRKILDMATVGVQTGARGLGVQGFRV